MRRRAGDTPREAGTGIFACADGYVSMVAGRLGTAAAWTWSTVCGFLATLRASTATYSAAAPSRNWSVSPYTSSPTANPAVP